MITTSPSLPTPPKLIPETNQQLRQITSSHGVLLDAAITYTLLTWFMPGIYRTKRVHALIAKSSERGLMRDFDGWAFILQNNAGETVDLWHHGAEVTHQQQHQDTTFLFNVDKLRLDRPDRFAANNAVRSACDACAKAIREPESQDTINKHWHNMLTAVRDQILTDYLNKVLKHYVFGVYETAFSQMILAWRSTKIGSRRCYADIKDDELRVVVGRTQDNSNRKILTSIPLTPGVEHQIMAAVFAQIGWDRVTLPKVCVAAAQALISTPGAIAMPALPFWRGEDWICQFWRPGYNQGLGVALRGRHAYKEPIESTYQDFLAGIDLTEAEHALWDHHVSLFKCEQPLWQQGWYLGLLALDDEPNPLLELIHRYAQHLKVSDLS